MMKPAHISTRHEHRGRVIEVTSERLQFANGRVYDMDLVHHPGAAAVVALDDRGRVCLVRQYRLGVEEFMWEVPAGKLDAGELPEICAVRELKEETGVVADQWTALGLFIPAPGIYTEKIYLYLARSLHVGAPAPDADEELELQWLPLGDALDRVLQGEWNDGKTAVALARADYQLKL
jgi:8-oxo-dGTP pyrophosphatase MutT (NUDIX family)